MTKPDRIAIAVALGAVVLRLWGIGSDFPIITDEAIYLRWAEIIEHQGQWFISLLDGKPPLSYWLYALGRFLWDGDPLLISRSLSAAAGGATTWLLFLMGRRLLTPAAGLFAAAAYAVFPWAMVHERLGLAEPLIAAFGAGVVYLAIRAFESREDALRNDLLVGLAFGAALFTKTTALLFLPALVGAAFFSSGPGVGRQAVRLIRILAVASVFPLITPWLTPDAPTLQTTSSLLHESSRFSDIGKVVANPFRNFGEHWPKVAALLAYAPWPALLFAAVSLFRLTWKRSPAAWVFWLACALPAAAPLFMLEAYDTRYAYPHMWGWALVVGAGLASVEEFAGKLAPGRAKAVAAGAAAVVLGSMAFASLRLHLDPRAYASRYESGQYFGSYPHVGYGLPEAVDFLRAEAGRNGGLTLLTVPLWGVPADAFSAYLNQRDGIRVYEAWWLQSEGGAPIMPRGAAEMVRSHYERVSAGPLDFRRLGAVYFATDSEQMSREQVLLRQPGARLVQSFRKPEGENSIDVYRLK